MKISIDTKEDSHEDIRKAIRMLQNIVGDAEETFTNQQIPESSNQEAVGPLANIFGDTATPSSTTTSETTQETQQEETSESTEDLFAELFSEEEIEKMKKAEKKDEEEEIKQQNDKYKIELY